MQLPTLLPHLGDWCVHFDRQRLRQVLLNLVSNAIKYNREGGRVSILAESAPGCRLRIGISDTGPGIPRERFADLFVPFERLGAESSDVPGTGLGLSLTRSVLQAMGGEIYVESTLDEGSTFWIELPLEPEPVASAREAPAGEPVRRRRVGRRMVLHIEDNPANVRVLEKLTRKRADLDLVSALQGSVGLELATHHLPDLILLDLHLPDISGDQLLRRLRECESTREIPVVVVSADAMPKTIERLRAAGALDFLVKPYDIPRLLAVIEEVLPG